MGTTIVICITLILLCVVICSTYLIAELKDSDEERLNSENRKLKEEIKKLKSNESH